MNPLYRIKPVTKALVLKINIPIIVIHLDGRGRLTNMSPKEKKKKKVHSPTNPYAMGTNLSGWGYPLSQTLAFPPCLPSIAVDDINPTLSGSCVSSGKPLYRDDEEWRL